MSVWEICTTFPMLSPTPPSSPNPTALHGFISIGSTDYEVSIGCPKFPSIVGLTINTDSHLAALISTASAEIREASSNCKSVLEFLLEFEKICSRECEQNDSSLPSLSQAVVDKLLKHIDILGWHRIYHLCPSLTSIMITKKDTENRIHKLDVGISNGYPLDPPSHKTDLPIPFIFDYKPSDGVCSIVEAWEKHIEECQGVWRILDELDQYVLIIDPPYPPPLNTTSRRIILENHVSVQLTLSVSHPHQQPDKCHLLGPTHLTQLLSTRLTQKYQNWDPERSLIDNLEAMFGERVVRKNTNDDGGTADDCLCAICYCLHLEEELPDLTCDHCAQTFHPQCLYEWLRGQTNTRHSVSGIFGECPNCEKLIMCKLKDK